MTHNVRGALVATLLVLGLTAPFAAQATGRYDYGQPVPRNIRNIGEVWHLIGRDFERIKTTAFNGVKSLRAKGASLTPTTDPRHPWAALLARELWFALHSTDIAWIGESTSKAIQETLSKTNLDRALSRSGAQRHLEARELLGIEAPAAALLAKHGIDGGDEATQRLIERAETRLFLLAMLKGITGKEEANALGPFRLSPAESNGGDFSCQEEHPDRIFFHDGGGYQLVKAFMDDWAHSGHGQPITALDQLKLRLAHEVVHLAQFSSEAAREIFPGRDQLLTQLTNRVAPLGYGAAGEAQGFANHFELEADAHAAVGTDGIALDLVIARSLGFHLAVYVEAFPAASEKNGLAEIAGLPELERAPRLVSWSDEWASLSPEDKRARSPND